MQRQANMICIRLLSSFIQKEDNFIHGSAPWCSSSPLKVSVGDLSISAHAESDPSLAVWTDDCLTTPSPAPLLSDGWNLLSFPQPPWNTCTYLPPLPAATAATQRAAWAPTPACTPLACLRPTAPPEPWHGPPRPCPALLSSQPLMWVSTAAPDSNPFPLVPWSSRKSGCPSRPLDFCSCKEVLGWIAKTGW